MFAGNFAPAGWEFCSGQLLPISEYETLFNLIGTTYGGDGESTFALPDLQGRIPLHQGSGFILAETGGVEEVTLTVNQIPAHTHPMVGSAAAASTSNPANNVYAVTSGFDLYFPGVDAPNQFAAGNVLSVGGSQPHNNMQPYLAVSFIISLYGIFPSPT